MDAKDTILRLLIENDGTERHPLEQVVHLLEHGARLFDIFVETLSALLTEAKILVDIAVLVVTTEHENLPRILQLESKEQADDLERLGASINVVTKEDVIETADVASLLRRAPDIEESHQVSIVTVDVSEYLRRRLQVLDEHGLCLEDLSDLIDKF